MLKDSKSIRNFLKVIRVVSISICWYAGYAIDFESCDRYLRSAQNIFTLTHISSWISPLTQKFQIEAQKKKKKNELEHDFKTLIVIISHRIAATGILYTRYIV